MLRDEHNKGKEDRRYLGYKTSNNSREALLLDKNNGKTLGYDEITKEMSTLDHIDGLQLYPPKTKLYKREGWQYVLIYMVFDVKHQYLQHKARMVFGVHVADSK